MAKFNYSLLVRMFSNSASLKKIENPQKRALVFLYKSHKTSYEEIWFFINECKTSKNTLC